MTLGFHEFDFTDIYPLVDISVRMGVRIMYLIFFIVNYLCTIDPYARHTVI